MIAPALFSSASDEWATPLDLFSKLNRRYGPFDVDVCATADNAKCERYYSPEVDGLTQPWEGRCWMNPPYGKTIAKWIRKAWEASQAGAMVVCLLPARTDTRWWQGFVLPFAEVEFLPGRLKFGDATNSAPFPSAVVIFRPKTRAVCGWCAWCESFYVHSRSDAEFCSARCKQAAYRARGALRLSVTADGERCDLGDGEEAERP